MMDFRVPSRYDRSAASFAARTPVGSVSKTIQQFKDESDINVLARRFGITGDVPVARTVPEYGDFSEVVDFHSAMTALRGAQEAFNDLPAHVRDRFANDPRRLVDFLGDRDNLPEAVKLGLVPRPVPDPTPTPTPDPVGDSA